MDEELVETDDADGRRAAARRARGKGPQPRGHRRPDANPAAPPRKHRSRRLGQASGADLHDRLRQELCERGRARPDAKSATSCARKWAASASPATPAEVFEPADPARTMPKWLVFGAIVAVIVLDRADELAQPPLARAVRRAKRAAARRRAERRRRQVRGPPRRTAAAAASAGAGRAHRDARRRGSRSRDQGKTPVRRACCSPGQTFAVPPTATAPMLKAGKPEALRITVGNRDAPPVGPPGKVDVERQPHARRPDARTARQPSAPPVPAAIPPAQ